jgi:hypothetical protein
MKQLAYAIFLAAAYLVTGCISFPKQAFDKHAHPGVKSIALLEVTPPATLAVANLGGVGSSFGLIGASIDSAEQERKTNDFNSVVEQGRREFGPRMQDALKLGLERNGYSVTVLSGVHPVRDGEDDQDADYSAIATDADVILDVYYVRASYLAPGADYLPWLMVGARLIDARTKARVYAQQYGYGNAVGAIDNVEHIPSDPKFKYDSADALQARAPEAIGGLHAGIGLIAQRIVSALR